MILGLHVPVREGYQSALALARWHGVPVFQILAYPRHHDPAEGELAAFKKAKDTPPPSDPAQANQLQEQILTTLSQDLANAISVFVAGGDVTGVRVVVVNASNVQIGTGAQTGTGKVQ